jgi:head-tail adaptor
MFTSTDLTNMRLSQTDRMQDKCYLQARSVTPNSMNEQVESWADTGSEISCGLEMKSGSESHRPENVVVQYDAVLRLPITTTVTELQRIRVTKRYAEALATPLVFDIVSPIQRGPSAIRILLKKVSV